MSRPKRPDNFFLRPNLDRMNLGEIRAFVAEFCASDGLMYGRSACRRLYPDKVRPAVGVDHHNNTRSTRAAPIWNTWRKVSRMAQIRRESLVFQDPSHCLREYDQLFRALPMWARWDRGEEYTRRIILESVIPGAKPPKRRHKSKWRKEQEKLL